jgi:hypothetical protein
MRTVRILAVFAFVIMSAAVVFGLVSGGFGEESSTIWALSWGKVTLIDLYLGLLLFGGWIAYREGNRGVVLAWWAALAVLGNLAAAAYLLRATFTAGTVGGMLSGRHS